MLRLSGYWPDDPGVRRLGVAQIVEGRGQGGAGARQTRLGLGHVGPAAGAAGKLFLQEAEDHLVDLDVFFGQADQLALPHDLEVGADGIQRREFRILVDPQGGRPDAGLFPLDGRVGLKAVENPLLDVQRAFHPSQGQGLLVVHVGAGVAVLGPLLADAGGDVDLRQVEAARLAQLLLDGLAVVCNVPDVRAVLQSELDRVLHGGGMDRAEYRQPQHAAQERAFQALPKE